MTQVVKSRSVVLLSPRRLRITVDDRTTEYDLQVWRGPDGIRLIELHNRTAGVIYGVKIEPYGRKKQLAWTCDCPDAKRRRHACKHVLALRAGLKAAGYRV